MNSEPWPVAGSGHPPNSPLPPKPRRKQLVAVLAIQQLIRDC